MKNETVQTSNGYTTVGCMAFLLLTLAGGTHLQADWPQFRGPTGDGHVLALESAPAIGLPLTWSETNNISWKTEIPDRGWSTPAIMNKQVWLTTAPVDGHDFYVFCLDADSGKVLFTNNLFHCDNPESQGNAVNSYATPSPTIEAGRVYIHFGSYGTACIDTTSFKSIWERTDLKCRHYRGPASSPIIFENLLILTMDGVDLQYMVALDKTTGKTVWKTDRSVAWNDEDATDQMTRDGDRRKAHSTPIIVRTDDKLQMLIPGAKAAYSYDPRTGRELWRVQYDAWSASSMALCTKGLAIFISGFGGKTEMLAVKTDGQGDVTKTHVAWRYDKMVSKTASPILVNGLLYMISDDGMITCLEPETGVQVWRERIAGAYASSPIYADGRIYFCNQQGKTFVVKPSRTYELLAVNILDTGSLASPAVQDKAIYLRTKTHVYRIETTGK